MSNPSAEEEFDHMLNEFGALCDDLIERDLPYLTGKRPATTVLI